MKIDAENLGVKEAQKLLSGVIVPRPIAFVSTISHAGVFNLAPFSFFAPVCYNPPSLCLSITRRQGQKKDTLKNIEFARDFVVNVVDVSLAEAMNITSADYPSDISEFKEAGLTPLTSDKVKSPRVAEAPISMECRLVQIVEIGRLPNNNSLVIGEIVQFHIQNDLYLEGSIDPHKFRALGRLSGDLYCHNWAIFEMRRPKYVKA